MNGVADVLRERPILIAIIAVALFLLLVLLILVYWLLRRDPAPPRQSVSPARREPRYQAAPPAAASQASTDAVPAGPPTQAAAGLPGSSSQGMTATPRLPGEARPAEAGAPVRGGNGLGAPEASTAGPMAPSAAPFERQSWLPAPLATSAARRLPAEDEGDETVVMPAAPKLALLGLLINRSQPGERFDVDKPNVSIGRARASDILLESPTVSRQHASIRLETDGFVLYDLGSANGSFVNGERVTGPVALQDGAVVRFGEVEFTFNLVSL